jgi:hypothetical protein
MECLSALLVGNQPLSPWWTRQRKESGLLHRLMPSTSYSVVIDQFLVLAPITGSIQ